MPNQIPLPQNTKLFKVISDEILKPKISVLSLDGNCSISSYSDLKNNSYLYQVYNQQINSMIVKINDKNVLSFPKIDNVLNGFDSGFNYYFLNLSSPTIIFLPLIQSIDNGQNIELVSSGSNYLINNWKIYLNNQNLFVNNLILLTNQNNKTQNIIYRIIDINGSILTVSNPSNINAILSKDQKYIFTRALINNGVNQFYYGLNNSNGYSWISQTQEVQLSNVDYGVTINYELNNLTLDISIFNILSLVPKINQKIAVNVSGGGYTTGIYTISNITNKLIYLQSIYEPYVFIHQFTKVLLDLNTVKKSIWYVNPDQVGTTNWTYGAIKFSFNINDPSNLINLPNLWGQQVGGTNDNIIGFVLYTNNIPSNNFVLNSDIFNVTIVAPTSISGSNFAQGLSLDCNYSNEIIPIREGYI